MGKFSRMTQDLRFDRGWETAVCIASGPSLTKDQVEFIRERRSAGRVRILAVNDNFRLAPDSDVVYACDRRWWDTYITEVKEKTKADLWTMDRGAAEAHRINWVEASKMKGVAHNGKIAHGQNSGYQAINLAYLFGATKIVLIGYDCKYGDDGKRHWFGNHPKGWSNANRCEAWLNNFKSLASEIPVDVVNCSLDTAIKSFRMGKLEDEI